MEKFHYDILHCFFSNYVWYFDIMLEFGIRKKFWTLNAVQVVYNFIVVRMNRNHNNMAINGRKIFGILCAELLLITVLIFLAGSTKNDNGAKVTAIVLFILIVLLAGLIYFLFRSNLNPFSFWIANMYGLAATLVVYRSNQYMLSLTYEQSMQQWIYSCLITYLISLIFFTGSKTIYKLRKIRLDNRV